MMEMMKRTSSQTYDGTSPNGNTTRGGDPANQSGTVSGTTATSLNNTLEGSKQGPMGGIPDATSKKARFVSEGHIPAMDYDGQAYGQLAHNAPVGYLNAAALSSLASQQQNQQQQTSQPSPHYNIPGNNTRSFSASMMNSAGNMIGLGSPTSPYMGHQYTTMPSGGSMQQQSGYNQIGSPQSAQFIGAQSPMGAALFNPAFQNPSMQGGAGMGAFIPNVNLLSLSHQGNAIGRTVYVGNLPAEASVDELLNQVKFGPIENVRLLPEKSCAFLSFLDGGMAAAFHADASVKKMSLHNQELKIGWGKPSACPTPILIAVQQSQATRNVYLGQLEEEVTEQSLRDDLARFGPIDQVKIVRDKNIGFVHFLSIGTAMKVVSMLPTEPAWTGKRVHYGKDRCAYVPKSQQQNQAHNSQAAAMGMAAAASLGYPTAFSPASTSFGGFANTSPGAMTAFGASSQLEDPQSGGANGMFNPMVANNVNALQQLGNRTVYLGNIHPDTSTEEICNHIRGGILQNIRFIPEKHIAFITFVDSNAALAFYHLANYSGIMIHQRRLKIGWGKHSGPLSPAIAMAVQAGGSRNVYVGNIEDFNLHNVDKLKRDFSEYGEIELVNTLTEKSCAFINFCNIQNAIKAIEAIKNHDDYKNQRIGAGKDRCGTGE
jgi:RNA recognition motif-containing protein